MKHFMGSCAVAGAVGHILVGTEARYADALNHSYELLVDGVWTPVYDIMLVTGYQSPMEEDMTKV